MNTHRPTLLAVAAALAACLAQDAAAQSIIIAPAGAAESSHDTAFGASVAATTNGSGLSSVATVETGDDPATGFVGVTHDNSSGNMWRTFVSANGFGAPVDPAPVLTFDLGAAYDLSAIRYWNYNETFESDRGIREVNVSTSADGIDFSAPTLITLAQAGGFGGDAGASVSLTATNVQYVRFSIVSNYGDADLVGLGEIRFVGASAIPEPGAFTALASLAAGSFVVVGRRRRDRR